ncbi:sulfite exporter TauE/SafE family protein [Pseudomonadota bacterium]|nr:sulfite exporter TauE/SafE family protein [Pseudomonadota bacterium]
MIEWMVFAVIGIITGIFSGLLGLGGGVVVVPSLMAIFTWQAMPVQNLMHIAIGTSLMTITITSLSSSYAHYKYQHINWQLFKWMVPGLVLGGLTGAYFATSMSSHLLQRYFALYMFFVVIQMWLPKLPLVSTQLLNKRSLSLFGVLAGAISALVGIGGGSLVVPYLTMAKQSMQKAIGTSAACGFPISVAAVTGFIMFGQHHDINEQWLMGQIHWQAFLGIVSTSIVFSILGAKLTKVLPVRVLKQVFSIVLLVVTISLIE